MPPYLGPKLTFTSISHDITHFRQLFHTLQKQRRTLPQSLQSSMFLLFLQEDLLCRREAWGGHDSLILLALAIETRLDLLVRVSICHVEVVIRNQITSASTFVISW
jgi:hypothetical protein